VQFDAERLGIREDDLAEALGAIAREHHLGVICFRAGAIHDSLLPYKRLAQKLTSQKRMSTRLPSVRVFEDLDVWSIVALIASADLVMSTSLHVRIVSSAFSIPRISLNKYGNGDKYGHFVQNFDKSALSGLPLIGENGLPTPRDAIATAASLWLARPESEALRDRKRAQEVAQQYVVGTFRNFSQLLAGRCSLMLPPLASLAPPRPRAHR